MEGSIFTSDECVICMDVPASIVFRSCAHMCTCNKCAERVKSANLYCPMCRGAIESFEEASVVALIPSTKELLAFEAHKKDYMVLLSRGCTKNAGYVGKGKHARAVSRHIGSELEERYKESAGTERFGGKSPIFTIDGEKMTISYKIQGKRKPTVEIVDFLSSWDEVKTQLLEIEEEMDTVGIATHYPQLFWLAKYHGLISKCQ